MTIVNPVYWAFQKFRMPPWLELVLVIFVGSFSLKIFPGIVGILIYAGLASAIIIPNKIYKSNITSIFKALLPNPTYTFFGTNGGIGISKEGRYIVVHQRQFVKKYDFDQIRSWSWNQETAGKLIGPQLYLLRENSKLRSEVAARSGFTVNVKDIEHPEWFIIMKNDDQKKWFEIFNQLVNES